MPTESQHSFDEEKLSETTPQETGEQTGWDGPQDPNNPQNWPLSKRYDHVALVSILTLLM